MRKRRRLTLAGLAAAATAAAVVAASLTTPTASADVTTQHFATSGNASDPFMFVCNHPTRGGGYCMVTSKDMNRPGIYPMEETLSFFSKDGVKWVESAQAIHENNIPLVGWNADHLWAPAAKRHVVNGQEKYWLYVPDLTNAQDKYSSKIFAVPSIGADPLRYGADGADPIVRGAPNSMYMSDPEVFETGSLSSFSDDYLIWANGDFGSCGGFSIRRMTGPRNIVPFSNPSEAAVTINGLYEALGSCTRSTDGVRVNQPYVEGASLFRFTNWQYPTHNGALPGTYVMVFAAKPGDGPDAGTAPDVPAECQQSGQPNTDKSVIAYATASSVTGPYTYRGIIMCGSSTEWTNQATIAEVRALNGEYRLILVYHDGPSPVNDVRSRRTHSECLLVRNGKFMLTSRSPEGAASVSGNKQWCLQADTVVAIKSVSNGKYVRSDSNGVMTASKTSIGLWEHFALMERPDGLYLHARNPHKWVQVNRANDSMMARGESPGAWEKFTFQEINRGAGYITYAIKDSENKWIRVDSTGKLVQGSAGSPSDNSYFFRFEYLSS